MAAGATAAPNIGTYPRERSTSDRVRGVAPRPAGVEVRAATPAVRRELHGAPPADAGPAVSFDLVRRLPHALQGKLVVDRETSAVSIEQYRRLAATLHGLQVQTGLRTIMVSSALPRDGKTLTTANLALTLSESYKRRVLVIDADLRRPSIHEVFQVPNERGLANGLRESSATLPVLELSPTLAVLTAGRTDATPMAGLTSARMGEIVEEASRRFDWVLLDTPPIGLISDAQLLAGLVDGVILVVGAGATDYTTLTHTVEGIGRERIIGIVLNRVQEPPAGRSGYHDYYYNSAGEAEPESGQ